MTRAILPQRRPNETYELKVAKGTYSVTFGYYPNGRVGEIFINGAKSGSDMDAVCRDAAVILSIAIQHGSPPLETIAHAITRESNGAASSIIGVVIDRLLSV
jgi:hypothetical protein